jgi:predicted lipoprotein with Yx(FWY)xxD motif
VRRCRHTAIFAGLVLIASMCPVYGQWTERGVQVSSGLTSQRYPIIIPDNCGGAIVAWLHYPGEFGDGQADIYAQRLNADGYLLWPQSGVPVCTADTLQLEAAMATDGRRGAIIVWQDRRDADDNIYAQRVRENGSPAWAVDGVPICTAAGEQRGPCIAPDGRGGAFIAWQDGRNGADETYAQRVDSSGAPLWAGDGVRVCVVPEDHFAPYDYPRIIADGRGGAIIAWIDTRTHKYKVFAQRVDGDGQIQWVPEGVAVSPTAAEQEMQKLVTDGCGGAIISWRQERLDIWYHDNIYAQRIDSLGTVRWGETGAPICTGNWRCSWPDPVANGEGGALISWEDMRTGQTDIYIQRVDADGQVVWATDGIPVCDDLSAQGGAASISDGAGGAITLWFDFRIYPGQIYSGVTYVQRTRHDGTIAWAEDGVPLQSPEWVAQATCLAADGNGGAIIPWKEIWGDADGMNIFAKKINGDGSVPVPTLLQSYHAVRSGEGIRVEWILSEELPVFSFIISRMDVGSGSFEELPGADIVKEGLSFSFVDRSCEPGMSYRYRVAVVEGEERRVLFETDVIEVPRVALSLYQNYPNPFIGGTRIGYYLPEAGEVRLEVYDSAGRRIAVLERGRREMGRHEVEWSPRLRGKKSMSPGVYYYRLVAGKENLTRKMTLIQ